MMKFVWSPEYEVDIGVHVFPTAKYRLIREKLLADGTCSKEDFLVPVPATKEQLLLVHTRDYLEDLHDLRRTERTMYSELPLRHEIINGYYLAAGGTILACRAAVAVSPHVSCHIGGGFHHAFANHAEGFCYINDIAVAARVLQQENLAQRVLVIDLDLHQGNGTAHIFAGDPTVFTISVHQENNYPQKQKSDIDIGLSDYADDDEYLSHLEEIVPEILDSQNPDLVIFVAGADPYQDDQLGNLKVTIHGLAERDQLVLSETIKRNIPVVTVTAGGYAQHVMDTVQIHAQTCQIAAELFKQHSKKERKL